MAMHRINHVEVELHTGDAALARALSERVGRMHQDRIAPVLDRVCNELGASEALFRIDRLELDLGTLAADDLEDAFVARLEPALRAALVKALRRTVGDQRVRASLELLETFALTGSLPWWAPHDREVVARHFARAAVEARADLVALLGRLAYDSGALDRIARMCDRSALMALVERAQAGQPLPRSIDRGTIGNPSATRASPPAASAGGRDAQGHPDPGNGARSTQQSGGDAVMAQRSSAASHVTEDAPPRRLLADPTPLDERQAPARNLAASDRARSTQQPGDDEATAQWPSAASRVAEDAPRRRPLAEPTPLDERQAPARNPAAGDGARATEQHGGDEATAQRPSAASRLTDDAPRGRQPTDPEALDERQARVRDTASGGGASSPPQSAGDEVKAQSPSATSRLTSDAARRRSLADPDALDERQAPAQGTAPGDGARATEQHGGDEAREQAPSATSRLTSDAARRRPLSDPDALDERQARVRDTASGGGASSPPPSAGDEVKAQALSATSRLTSDAARRRPLADPDALDERRARAPDRAPGDTAPPSDLPPVHDATPLVERRPPVPPVLAALLATSPRMAAGTPRLPPVPAAPAAIRSARRGALARLDELYVADAGLVILWPFLERFFLRTGVLGDDHRFFDEAAQLQAVALVEGLATPDPAPLEFHLPLAKLLCGRPFESDFVLARPLAPEQLAEGDRLLAAAIDRAPVPAELSIASFRAGFLSRPGALGTRDGAWLLQVERRPHDAVLDRFPWSWGWIKLPWMPEPLRVDW